eukprot:1551377-Pleurochrysis_carterae.AAC.2
MVVYHLDLQASLLEEGRDTVRTLVWTREGEKYSARRESRLWDVSRRGWQPGGLVGTCVVSCGGHGRVRGGRSGSPGEGILVERHLRGEHDSWNARHVYVVSSGRGKTAPKVYADPGARFNARFRVRLARFNSKRSAPEGKYWHDAGHIRAGRPSCPVEYVHRVRHGICPERGGCSARHEVRTCEFHNAADRPLGHPVQLVYVRRTRRGVDALVSEEFRELFGEKLPGIVTM